MREGPELISRGAAMDESHRRDGDTSRLYTPAPRPRRTRLHIRTKAHIAAGLVTIVNVVVAIILGLNGFYSTRDGSSPSRTPVHAAPDHDVDDHLLPLRLPGTCRIPVHRSQRQRQPLGKHLVGQP